MTKLLSISIPTFNRAPKLQRQIAWLAQDLQGFEAECEVLISDNHSTDRTWEVIQQWQSAFAQVSFKAHRQETNIGLLGNLAYCLHQSQGLFSWIIGDDDVIQPGTLAEVIKILKEHQDLTLLYLNFSGRNAQTQQIEVSQWLDADLRGATNGQEIFQRCIERRFGSVIFLSATIMHTACAQTALRRWPESIQNWGAVAYWTGSCATQGKVLVTQQSYIECLVGDSHWQNEPDTWFKMHYRDVPEIYARLPELGYPVQFCGRMILKTYKECFAGPEIKGHLKIYLRSLKALLRALKRWPQPSASILLVLLTFGTSLLPTLKAIESDPIEVRARGAKTS